MKVAGTSSEMERILQWKPVLTRGDGELVLGSGKSGKVPGKAKPT